MSQDVEPVHGRTTSVGTIVVIIHDVGAAKPEPYRIQFDNAWVEAESSWDVFFVYGDRPEHGLSGLLLGRFNARTASWYIKPGLSWRLDTGQGLAPATMTKRNEVRFDRETRFILHEWGRVEEPLPPGSVPPFAHVALLDVDETIGEVAVLREALMNAGALCLTPARAGTCQCGLLQLSPIL